jgi:hypothetical protein
MSVETPPIPIGCPSCRLTGLWAQWMSVNLRPFGRVHTCKGQHRANLGGSVVSIVRRESARSFRRLFQMGQRKSEISRYTPHFKLLPTARQPFRAIRLRGLPPQTRPASSTNGNPNVFNSHRLSRLRHSPHGPRRPAPASR